MNISGFLNNQSNKHKDKLSDFLNKFDKKIPEGLSELVKETDQQVWEQVNCKECANCCKVMTPTYTKADIARISKHLNMSKKEFFERYLEKEEDTGSVVHQQLPCSFLKNNICSIYEVRPEDCAGYPYHDKRPFDEYSLTYIQNLEYCPATYLLVEKLEKVITEEYEWS